MRVDINSDLGESFGAYSIGHDAGLMHAITSANVAAGMTVVHGSSKARHDIELQSEYPSHVALHVGLRGSARPRVEATGRVLPSGSGDFVVSCLPASRVAVELDDHVHNEAFRVNLTND